MESDLLQLKLLEGDFVDQWIISQATTTFRGHRRTICYPDLPSNKITHRVVDTSQIRGQRIRRCRRRNALQRNALLEGLHLEDDDIFIFSDLDEIIRKKDRNIVVNETEKHGFVFFSMRYYFIKINLIGPKQWIGPFAATGKFLREHPDYTVNKLRVQRKRAVKGFMKHIPISGQHFSWLCPWDDDRLIKMKNRNNSWERGKWNQDRLIGPKGTPLTPVPVDHTFPETIRANPRIWDKYTYEAIQGTC